MRALPDQLKTTEDEVTGISCVECPGVLEARIEGNAVKTLHFTCRVGHVFSTNELVAGKERKLDEWLWSALLAMEELAQLLVELARHESDAHAQSSFSSRAAQLRAQAQRIRDLIDENQPIALSDGSSSATPDCAANE